MATAARSRLKVFVGNLPWTVGDRELRNFFTEFGSVLSAKVVFDKTTGCSKGHGYVLYSNHQALKNIENKSRLTLEGQQLTIVPKVFEN